MSKGNKRRARKRIADLRWLAWQPSPAPSPPRSRSEPAGRQDHPRRQRGGRQP